MLKFNGPKRPAQEPVRGAAPVGRVERFRSARSYRTQANPITRPCGGPRPPEKFDPRNLVAVLRGNPVTQAMLNLCPAKYERY